MAASGVSRAQANRKIRQDALREQLAEQCRLQHVLDNIKKIESLDPLGGNETTVELNILKTANEQRMKLVNKYLPDLKSTELTGEGGGAIAVADLSQYTDEELRKLASAES